MFRFSLRELLAVVLVLGLVLASMRVGGLLASALLICIFVFLIVMAINAFAGQGNTRVFAIGFLIPCVVYAAILAASGARELDPYGAKVPTAQLLGYLHQFLAGKEYYDMQGNLVVDYDPTTHDVVAIGFGGLGGGMLGAATYPNNAVTLVEKTDRGTFMSLGHGLVALLFGWVGGKYAVYVSRKED